MYVFVCQADRLAAGGGDEGAGGGPDDPGGDGPRRPHQPARSLLLRGAQSGRPQKQVAGQSAGRRHV